MTAVASLVLILLGLGFYFIPTIVAGIRNSSLSAAAVIVNVFLGWTLVGWVVALALAVSGKPAERPPLPPAKDKRREP
jgi:cytochrome c biogenesis protein CcdA